MAVTALKVGDNRIKFMTLPEELVTSQDGENQKKFLTVDLRACDEDFIPSGIGSYSVHEDDEETYHKKLRIAALEKGHFVPEESTNHEWHPGYKPEDDIEYLDTTDNDTSTI